MYLRGGMNGWGAREEYAFEYKCDAFYLNIDLTGRAEFKLGDANWSNKNTYGSAATARSNLLVPGQPYGVANAGAAGGANNLSFPFSGEHTVKLTPNADGSIASVTIGDKTFPDKPVPQVTDPLALSLQFDSRSSASKSPFGAVAAGTPVQFALSSKAGVDKVTLVIEKRRLEGNEDVLEYTEVARVPLKRAGEQWKGSYRFADPSVYGYYFEASIGGKTYVYQNNKRAVYWERERGANGQGAVADMPAERTAIRRFRHTVYAAGFTVPSWAKDAVYYYIFPERFRNGDRSNDPKVGVNTFHDKPIEFHSNWLDKPYRPGSGDGSDKYASNDFYGGDLAGIIEKLDYIRDLGANTIYMTPVFRAASNHKYDAADYRHIDPSFGKDDDFNRLTAEAAKRGIRVIPDASLNHTGSDSFYFDRFGKYDTNGAFRNAKINPSSPYASWYTFKPNEAAPDKQYTGWTGAMDLPELNKASPDFRNFAYGAKDSIMNIWLDRGAAGWRMDVAPWVPDDFWREWRKAVKGHRPDALTIAETWFDASKYFLGDTFDSTMNYIFRNTVLDYAAGIKADVIYHNIEMMRESYPQQSFFALMNLLSTHDVARSLHYFGDIEGATPEQTALAKQRMRLAVFFQMTFPGAPAIYYGDEVGMTGGDDPLNRAGYPWADVGGKPDNAMLADFKAMTAMRKQYPVLRHGSLAAPLLLDENVIVLARKDGASEAIVATNNAEVARTVSVALPAGFKARSFGDALDKSVSAKAEGGKLTIMLPPLSGRALISR